MTGGLPLSDGGVALVDREDAETYAGHTWCAPKRYGVLRYVRARIGGKTVYLHRLIVDPSAGQVVDHINGDTLDNRRCNLRACEPRQNWLNRKKYSSNTSGYKGVSRDDKRWRATIKVDGRYIYLGGFDSPIEAALAYDRAAISAFGEFARPNFPTTRDWIILSSATVQGRP